MSLPIVQHPSEDMPSEARSGFFHYENIYFHGELQIGKGGRVAWFRRHQRIRFLDDDVTVFLDRVWGDGVILAGYDAGPTRLLDAIAGRKGYAVLLGLPKPFQRGETFDIVTERKIVGAFADPDAYWELAMSAPTQSLTLEVLDARGRGLRSIHVAAPRLRGLKVRHRGRALRMNVDSPSLYVPYRVDWRWN